MPTLLPGDHTFEIKMMRIQAYHVLCGALCDAIFNKPRLVTARTEAGHAYTFRTLNDEAVTILIEDVIVSCAAPGQGGLSETVRVW